MYVCVKKGKGEIEVGEKEGEKWKKKGRKG